MYCITFILKKQHQQGTNWKFYFVILANKNEIKIRQKWQTKTRQAPPINFKLLLYWVSTQKKKSGKNYFFSISKPGKSLESKFLQFEIKIKVWKLKWPKIIYLIRSIIQVSLCVTSIVIMNHAHDYCVQHCSISRESSYDVTRFIGHNKEVIFNLIAGGSYFLQTKQCFIVYIKWEGAIFH